MGKLGRYLRTTVRAALGACLAIALLVPAALVPAYAGTGDRTLYFHYTHNNTTARFTYMRSGRYDQGVLRQLNVFLADWRTKEPTNMDPALFDLLWTIYQETGATQPINVVSSYRSPKTNSMLRARSSGVAENSQHMRGKAMDIFIPGVPLSRLREVAMRHQVGGVGFYPTSGSPFVHVDTGSVRAWPRMNRAQLQKVFPDGRTLHLPTDGTPLSSQGRRFAELEWKKCHMVPCNGAPRTPNLPAANSGVMVASTPPVPATPSPRLFNAMFGGGTNPAVAAVAAVAAIAPVPMMRPSVIDQTPDLARPAALAPFPATKSPAVRLTTGPTYDGQTAVAALASLSEAAPKPRVLMTPRDDLMVTAYVPTTQDPGAQRALQMIIERETTASLPKPTPKAAAKPVQVAALQPEPSGLDALASLIQGTWNAVAGLNQPPLAAALQARVTAKAKSVPYQRIELIAPDVDALAAVAVHPDLGGYVALSPIPRPVGFLSVATPALMNLAAPASVPNFSRFVPATQRVATR